MSVVTDLDKEKTQALLAINALRSDLLDKIQQTQKDVRTELLQDIQGLEKKFKEYLQEIKDTIKDTKEQQAQRDASCKQEHEKQLERLAKEQQALETASLALVEKQKPNYYAIIPLIVLLISPFVRWFFEMHNDIVQTKAAIVILQEQQKQITDYINTKHIKPTATKNALASDSRALED